MPYAFGCKRISSHILTPGILLNLLYPLGEGRPAMCTSIQLWHKTFPTCTVSPGENAIRFGIPQHAGTSRMVSSSTFHSSSRINKLEVDPLHNEVTEYAENDLANIDMYLMLEYYIMRIYIASKCFKSLHNNFLLIIMQFE